MKIAIDISQTVFTGTGVASYTRNLVQSLLALDSENYFVLFGSSLRRQNYLIDYLQTLPKHAAYTAKLSLLPPSILAIIWNQWHLLPIETFTGAVDVVHTSDWTEPPSQIPKVTTIHDLIVYKYPKNLPDSIVVNQKRKLAWVKKESQLIIADSHSTKKDIISYLEIPPSKIRVVYLGVDPIFYPQKIDAILSLKKRLRIKKNYILCVGTREPRKNLQRVVTAFKNLHASDFELVIAGNPGWGKSIVPTENIIITGFIEGADLATLYCGAHLFVYPSLYEGFGLPVLEAMKCGTPVIVSNRGSLAEIVGSYATIVDPESTEDIGRGMSEILEMSQAKRKNIISKSIKYVSQFTWQKTAEETLKVYNEVIQ